MARSVVLGNGGLTVGLNESGLVHDFYYPYVGLENLTTARSEPHRIGVWVDNEFSWIDSDDWERQVSFNTDALISDISLQSKKLSLQIHLGDFVDAKHDIFARNLRVRNLSDRKRNIRVFFHQVFRISADGRADTVMYVPDGNYLLDYKGHCSILAYAETARGVAFDQYAVGNAGIEGKEGTFRDAEDGELSMSTVEHSSVDSTLRVSVDLEGGELEDIKYWLAVADSQTELEKLHKLMLGTGFEVRKTATLRHWHDWMNISADKIAHLPENYKNAVKKSLLTMKAHVDSSGGIIASCDSSIYNYGRDYYSYVWPRDGAYVIWPLIKLGYTYEPRKFFNFCKSIMHPDGYMMHKYQPDRAIGSTWHPLLHGKSKELAIQEDETASLVFMLGEYLKYSHDQKFIDSVYIDMVRPMAEFMCRFIDEETGLPHASYDLWEEKFLTNTYTVANTYAALLVAVDMARTQGLDVDADKWQAVADSIASRSDLLFSEDEGHYLKGFLLQQDGTIAQDTTLDVSSFFAVATFKYGSEQRQNATLEAIERDLLDVSPSLGTARYEDDNYFASSPKYKGNPWFVTTLWLAQYYARSGDKEKATRYVDWALKNSLHSGVLSEQISPEDSRIVGVAPLVWSHAELINAIIEL
jgi:GH15 family glucan-1,4-alpha-glucosidase